MSNLTDAIHQAIRDAELAAHDLAGPMDRREAHQSAKEAMQLVEKAEVEIEILKAVILEGAKRSEALKRVCGPNPESSIAIQNGRYMSLSLFLRAALGQQEPGN